MGPRHRLRLIVGGILRGQELISSAQINAVQTDANQIRTSVNTFRDKFVALPGDMSNPGDLINTDLTFSSTGNGDGRITGDRLGANTEAVQAWVHLGAAGLLGEVDANALNGSTLSAANGAFEGSVGGFYSIGNGVSGSNSNFNDLSGSDIWLVLGTSDGSGSINDNAIVEADQAAQLDRKVDDGDPRNGRVRGDTSNCTTTSSSGNDEIYDVNGGSCALALEL